MSCQVHTAHQIFSYFPNPTPAMPHPLWMCPAVLCLPPRMEPLQSPSSASEKTCWLLSLYRDSHPMQNCLLLLCAVVFLIYFLTQNVIPVLQLLINEHLCSSFLGLHLLEGRDWGLYPPSPWSLHKDAQSSRSKNHIAVGKIVFKVQGSRWMLWDIHRVRDIEVEIFNTKIVSTVSAEWQILSSINTGIGKRKSVSCVF